MAGRVEGKVAFITGAARGQGRSHALRLAQEGADIIAVDICAEIESTPYPGATEEDLAETVALVEATGQRIFTRVVDVRNSAEIDKALGEGVDTFGRLDIVVANAGIGAFGPVLDITDEKWDVMIDTNLSGVWKTAKAAIPHLRRNANGGAMVLTSSSAGLKGGRNLVHYSTAKHGVVGLMRSLAIELGSDNIRVNSVHPTGVNTDMLINETVRRLFRPDSKEATMEEFAARYVELHLLPIPWVEPIDVSNAILFLVSDEARYVTGVALAVDAGLTQK